MKTHSTLWYLIRGSFKGGAQKGAGWLLTNPGARATEYYMKTLNLSKEDVSSLTSIPSAAIPIVTNGVIANVNGSYLTTSEWNEIASMLEKMAKQKGVPLYDDAEYKQHKNKHSDIAHF
ncbi:hypothetical protein [Furfurilactobacillus entadae]|uniref:hypothetical protein n=1 Tax=Furfurilactobacillus entadae TaxID=2922307 RepID=UPI0035E85035